MGSKMMNASLVRDIPLIKPAKFIWLCEKYLPYLLPSLLIFSRTTADLTVLLVGILFLFRAYLQQDWQWLQQRWLQLNLVFWLYLLLINAPLSLNFADSLGHAFFYIRWPLFAAALAYWLLDTTARQSQFLISLGLVTLFILADTALQYVTGMDLLGHAKFSAERLTGPFSAPVPGIMMLRILFIAAFSCLFFRSLFTPVRRLLFILITLSAGVLFMFITGERMALMLFFAGSVVVIAGLWFDQKRHKIKLLAIFGGMFVILAFCMLMQPMMAERSIYSILAKLRHFADSDYGLVFKAAFAAWQQAPIFGNGLHTYRRVCEQMGLLDQWGMVCSHPHNLYLHIATDTGLVGLALFIALVVGIYRDALANLMHDRQWFKFSLSLAVLSVSFWPFIGGISILNNGVAALVWLGVGWALAMNQNQIKIKNKLSQKKWANVPALLKEH